MIIAVVFSLLASAAQGARPAMSGNPEGLHEPIQLRKLQQYATVEAGGNIVEFATNYVGNVVLNGATNPQPSYSACGQSCASFGRCNAWVWCGNVNGCNDGSGTILAYQRCDLKYQPIIEQGLSPGVYGTRGNSDLTSGAPLKVAVMNTPAIPSFIQVRGKDMQNTFDYACDGSAVSGYCKLSGDSYTLGQRCLADPLCYAFTYFPADNAAWLKGGNGITNSLMTSAVSSAVANPSAVLFYHA